MCVSMTMHHMKVFCHVCPTLKPHTSRCRAATDGSVGFAIRSKGLEATYGSSPHRCCLSNRRRHRISTGSGCSVRSCTETARLRTLTPYEFLCERDRGKVTISYHRSDRRGAKTLNECVRFGMQPKRTFKRTQSLTERGDSTANCQHG